MKQLLNFVVLALVLLGCSHDSSSLKRDIQEHDKKIVFRSDFNADSNIDLTSGSSLDHDLTSHSDPSLDHYLDTTSGPNHTSNIDLNKRPPWLKSFEPARPAPWTSGMDRAHTVFDPDKNHKVLEIKYPKGSLGPEQGGSQWISYLPDPREKVTVSYWVRFPKDFDFVRGGKLPGLVGGHQVGHPDSTVTGGVHPTGKNGWSARVMWRKGGQIVQYVYHMNQPGKWGEDFKWESNGAPALFKPGTWQKLTTEVTLNAPGMKNGRIRSWLDDVPALDIQSLEFRSTGALKIDAFYFSTFFGGDEPSWAATKDESIRFDDFEVFE